MSAGYILSIDQSTSGTKAFLYDAEAKLLGQAACPHRQYVSPEGWVSHDLGEIWTGTLTAVSSVLQKSKIDRSLRLCRRRPLFSSGMGSIRSCWKRLRLTGSGGRCTAWQSFCLRTRRHGNVYLGRSAGSAAAYWTARQPRRFPSKIWGTCGGQFSHRRRPT